MIIIIVFIIIIIIIIIIVIIIIIIIITIIILLLLLLRAQRTSGYCSSKIFYMQPKHISRFLHKGKTALFEGLVSQESGKV